LYDLKDGIIEIFAKDGFVDGYLQNAYNSTIYCKPENE
jgi:hypothetical protein